MGLMMRMQVSAASVQVATLNKGLLAPTVQVSAGRVQVAFLRKCRSVQLQCRSVQVIFGVFGRRDADVPKQRTFGHRILLKLHQSGCSGGCAHTPLKGGVHITPPDPQIDLGKIQVFQTPDPAIAADGFWKAA